MFCRCLNISVCPLSQTAEIVRRVPGLWGRGGGGDRRQVLWLGREPAQPWGGAGSQIVSEGGSGPDHFGPVKAGLDQDLYTTWGLGSSRVLPCMRVGLL